LKNKQEKITKEKLFIGPNVVTLEGSTEGYLLAESETEQNDLLIQP
jgi:hypothetical protein